MSFIKRSNSNGKIEIIKDENNFDIGTEYIYDGQLYKVTKKDTTDHLQVRRVIDSEGQEDIISLNSLKEDLKNELIKFVKKD